MELKSYISSDMHATYTSGKSQRFNLGKITNKRRKWPVFLMYTYSLYLGFAYFYE